jgi:hypothetical protein
MRRHLIGHSEEGRPIRVLYTGDEAASLRVLIVSRQHGDEHRARKAVRRFARTEPPDAPVPVAVALVPELNPDGAARRTRANAHGVDLNRDHLRLASAETQALHRFVRTWRPHLIVDVHSFPPRRRHLLARQLIYCHDVFLDVPTHPAAQHPALGPDGTRLLAPILSALSAAGYRSARYTRVTASGKVRHSTPDVVDGRNGLALRYGVPTVLVEGRRWSPGDDPALKAHVLTAMERALSLIVGWAQANYALLADARPEPPVQQSVPVRSRYRRAGGSCTLAFADARSGQIRVLELPERFTPWLKARARVSLPRAYAVPCAQHAVLEVLRRQAFALMPSPPDRVERIERYWVDALKAPRRPHRSPRKLRLRVSTEERPLNGYLLVPVAADGGRALAVFLEPASKYGLARFADMDLPLTPQSAYPVLRVL